MGTTILQRATGAMLAALASVSMASIAVAETPTKPLKIGLIGDFSGMTSMYGQPAKNSAELALRDINAAGGVWGQPVQLVIGDSGSSSQQALAEAQRMVSVEGVQVIITGVTSSGCLAIKEGVGIANNMLLMGTNCVSPVHTIDQKDETGVFVRIRSPILAMTGSLAKLTVTEKASKICVMYVNSAYGQAAFASFEKVSKDLDPAVSIQSANFPDSTAASYLSELQQCTANGHDTVVLAAYGLGQSDIIMKEGLENELVKRFYFIEDQEDPAIFDRLGYQPFDGFSGTSGAAIPGEGLDYFKNAYKAAYGAEPTTPLIELPYDSVVLASLAAAKAGSATPGDIRNSFYSIANAPGSDVVAGPEQLKSALASAAAGEDINYVGVSGMNEYDSTGENAVSGAKLWHVDGAAKKIITDGVIRYDSQKGEYTFQAAEGCKYCKPF